MPAGNVIVMSPRGKESIRKSNTATKGGGQVEEGGGEVAGPLSSGPCHRASLLGVGAAKLPSLSLPSLLILPHLSFLLCQIATT